jgi:hypothetical protein
MLCYNLRREEKDDPTAFGYLPWWFFSSTLELGGMAAALPSTSFIGDHAAQRVFYKLFAYPMLSRLLSCESDVPLDTLFVACARYQIEAMS